MERNMSYGFHQEAQSLNEHYPLPDFLRLLRKLDIPCFDQRSACEKKSTDSSDMSKITRALRPFRSACPATSGLLDWREISNEVVILRHPSLCGHARIPELFGISLLSPIRSSANYQLEFF